MRMECLRSGKQPILYKLRTKAGPAGRTENHAGEKGALESAMTFGILYEPTNPFGLI